MRWVRLLWLQAHLTGRINIRQRSLWIVVMMWRTQWRVMFVKALGSRNLDQRHLHKLHLLLCKRGLLRSHQWLISLVINVLLNATLGGHLCCDSVAGLAGVVLRAEGLSQVRQGDRAWLDLSLFALFAVKGAVDHFLPFAWLHVNGPATWDCPAFELALILR